MINITIHEPKPILYSMLVAMMGDDWQQPKHEYQPDHYPEDWGLDDDDLAEARTDYADVWN